MSTAPIIVDTTDITDRLDDLEALAPVILIDNAGALPSGTPAGTIVVVKA